MLHATCSKLNAVVNQPQRCYTFNVEHLWGLFAILFHHKILAHVAYGSLLCN